MAEAVPVMAEAVPVMGVPVVDLVAVALVVPAVSAVRVPEPLAAVVPVGTVADPEAAPAMETAARTATVDARERNTVSEGSSRRATRTVFAGRVSRVWA